MNKISTIYVIFIENSFDAPFAARYLSYFPLQKLCAKTFRKMTFLLWKFSNNITEYHWSTYKHFAKRHSLAYQQVNYRLKILFQPNNLTMDFSPKILSPMAFYRRTAVVAQLVEQLLPRLVFQIQSTANLFYSKLY